MASPFIVIATCKVKDGKLADEKKRAPRSAQYAHDHEPRTIGFHEFGHADGTEVDFIQFHPDIESFEHHMTVHDPSYQDFLGETSSVRVYGQPTEAIMDLFTKLGGPNVKITVIPEHLGGFTRGPEGDS
ncbi:hypothetical protein LWC34_21150 [Kibdelosporangium philippinense]|uniref:EthD domain-containing protein n=1 Tax=Kibdelosporangium philippinense TaxID=211113 RepID=A0ABS8ZBS0_9PSEU|nr:hypothetical protein [Kibdelosporangium philippinense]MCE7005316.1 hypothetical protein [Kibdelosporangium philippinense]